MQLESWILAGAFLVVLWLVYLNGRSRLVESLYRGDRMLQHHFRDFHSDWTEDGRQEAIRNILSFTWAELYEKAKEPGGSKLRSGWRRWGA